MNIIKNSKVCITTGLFVCLVGVSNPSYAASLDLSTGPLFLGANPQPNIFFSVDDSGSMDWEVTKSPGVAAIGAYSSSNGFRNRGNVDITPTFTEDSEMLESCACYNVNFYDTNKTYTPWIGEDQAGNA